MMNSTGTPDFDLFEFRVSNSSRFEGKVDFFAAIYDENPCISWMMLAIYPMLGICVAFLAKVAVCERSGELGQHRTLVNRLMSFNLDQTIFFYFCPLLIDELRIIVGPLPGVVCKIGLFCKNVIFTNISQICLAMTMTKFMFVCVYKSIPSVEDNFLSVFLYLLFNVISALSAAARTYLSHKPVINELICEGYYYEGWDEEKPDFNAPGLISGLCFLLHFALSLAIKIADERWKRKEKLASVKSKGLKSGSMKGINIGDLKTSWVILPLLVVTTVTFTKINKTHPKSLNLWPQSLLVFALHIILPMSFILALCLLFLTRSPKFRRIFSRVQHDQTKINPA